MPFAPTAAPKPVPQQLHRVRWRGRPIALRASRPGDEIQQLAFCTQVDPGDLHDGSRAAWLRRPQPSAAAAGTTLLAVERSRDGIEHTLGAARISAAGGSTRAAQFDIVVRADLKGQGLRELLLREVIERQRAQGCKVLAARVDARDARLLTLAKRLGFRADVRDTGTLAIELDL